MKLKKVTTQNINYPSRKDITPILITIALTLPVSANPQIDIESNQTKEATPVDSVERIEGYEPAYIPPIEEIKFRKATEYLTEDNNCTSSLPTTQTEEQNQTTIIKPRRLMGKIKLRE